MRTGLSLRSGDVITLTTHNFLTRPLADTRLLELQWLLNRMTAIRGAEESTDLCDDEESDSDSDDGGFPRPIVVSFSET